MIQHLTITTMKVKKEQQMGVPQKSKVMRYSYRIAFVLLVCFVPVFLQEAKAQNYIKLAKNILQEAKAQEKHQLAQNILYEGEVVKKHPHGKGTLIVVTEGLHHPVFTITGTFQSNEITENKISSPGLLINTGFDRTEVDTLTFSKVIYSIDKKTGLSLELIDPTYNIKLSYSFDKQRKKWRQNVLYCPNNVVDTYYREATTSMPAYKAEVECTMRTIDLSSDLLDGTGLIQDYGNRKLLYDNGIVVEMDKQQQHFRTTSSMGTVEGSLYSGEYKIDKFAIKAKDGSSWTATMTENRLNSIVHFTDGSKYEGIVVTGHSFKYGIFGFNLLQLDKIDVNFIYGKVTKPDGEVVTWINGETEEERHRRLSNILQDKWVKMVENGEISEYDAVIRQKEEDTQKAEMAKEEAAKDLCANILMNKWNCKQVIFKGKLVASSDSDMDGILKGFWGIDHTYFEGYAFLALDDNGDAAFHILAEPSSKAYSQGRGRALQVTSFCKDLVGKKKTGKWTMQDNKLLINGEDIGVTLLSDGKTFKYSGLLDAKLIVSQKLNESARNKSTN